MAIQITIIFRAFILAPIFFCLGIISRLCTVASALLRVVFPAVMDQPQPTLILLKKNPALHHQLYAKLSAFLATLQRREQISKILRQLISIVPVLGKFSSIKQEQEQNVGRVAVGSIVRSRGAEDGIFVNNIRNYSSLCSECHSAFSTTRFPSVIIVEPPPLMATSSSSSNNNNIPPFPQVMKYALQNVAALTVQLFLVLTGVPFTVVRREELLSLGGGNNSSSSGCCGVEAMIVRPVKKKEVVVGVEILRHISVAVDSDDIVDEIVSELRPFVEDLVAVAEMDFGAEENQQHQHAAMPASATTPARGSRRSSVASSGAHHHHHHHHQKQECCLMRERLLRLEKEAEPLGNAQHLSHSDMHRAITVRRIISGSIAPLLDAAVQCGVSSSSSSSSSLSSSRSDAPSLVHPGASQVSAPSSFLRRVIVESNFPSATTTISQKQQQLLLSLVTTQLSESSSEQRQRQQQPQGQHLRLLSFLQKIASALVPSSVPRIMNGTWNLFSSASGAGAFFLLQQQQQRQQHAMAGGRALFRGDLIQSRLAGDLQLLERFIGGAAKSKTFLFECEIPTLVDCAVLAVCLAAVHAENVPGLFATNNNNENDDGDEADDSVSSTRRGGATRPKLRCLYDFARKRTVKAWMERAMGYFYPGSVLQAAATSRSNNNNNNPPPTPPSNTDDDDFVGSGAGGGGGAAAGGGGAGGPSTRQTKFVSPQHTGNRGGGGGAASGFRDDEAAPSTVAAADHAAQHDDDADEPDVVAPEVKRLLNPALLAARILTAPLQLSPDNLERHRRKLQQQNNSRSNSRRASLAGSSATAEQMAEDEQQPEQSSTTSNTNSWFKAPGHFRRLYRHKMMEHEILSSVSSRASQEPSQAGLVDEQQH